MRRPILWATLFALIVTSTPAQAAESASARLATQLTTLLDQRGLDSVAARVPDETDRFVAALYYAKAQLLVVSARYSVPALLQEQIWNGKYRDAYTELHGGGTRDGKFFVVDLAGNGFAPLGEERGNLDLIYEDGVAQTTFNGDWKAQQLSKAEYAARLEAADARYAKMLAALIESLKTTS